GNTDTDRCGRAKRAPRESHRNLPVAALAGANRAEAFRARGGLGLEVGSENPPRSPETKKLVYAQPSSVSNFLTRFHVARGPRADTSAASSGAPGIVVSCSSGAGSRATAT